MKPHNFTPTMVKFAVGKRLVADNFGKLLTALRFKTPYEDIEELRKSKPDLLEVSDRPHLIARSQFSNIVRPD
jgi:hypothetical protein